ncbi:AfsR/SARP family transcriptional regulator [Streptomyces erythrochromogenes]|uniref:AfsR/SARP family transcriptional regulator n=1 Tax=Streptomyces erythrochromogenes TaxID=285574 RepID=UPI003693D693
MYEVQLPTPFLRLLGPFRLEGPHGPVAVQLPGRRVLAFLALSGPVSRSVLAGTLWPDVTEDHAHGSLRSALWRLHRGMQPVIHSYGKTLSLHEAVTVDVPTFSRMALGIVNSAAAPGDDPYQGLLFDGDLLPGWDDEWVVFERERLRQLRLHALETLSVLLARRGQYALALDVALTGVSLEPLRESGHRAVVAVHLAERNTAEAVRHYEAYRRMATTELGLAPSPEFTGILPSGTLDTR